jgi:PAS domain S-box-containing protein
MNWMTTTWSMVTSACLTIALIHLVIWLQDRRNLVHLLFAVAAMSVAGIAVGELQMMLARTPEEFGVRLRWTHVPVFFAVVSIVWFVRLYFGTGRMWLAWSVCATRFLALALNFVVPPNLNYNQITALRRVEVLGGAVSAAEGQVSGRTWIGELSSLLLLAFAVDAAVALWRRGGPAERRRAIIVGGSVILFDLIGAGHIALIHAGLINLPYMVSLAFLLPVAAMGYELGADVVRTGQLARELDASRAELRENAQQMESAATAGELGLWRWDVGRDEFWVNQQGRALLELDRAQPMNLDHFLTALVPEDRDSVRQAVGHSLAAGTDFEREYRVRLRDGANRWIVARGRVEPNGAGKPLLMRGVCFDITRRKQAEERFRLVVEASPSALIVVRSDGAISLVNVQAEKIFGYSRNELLGQPIEVLIPENFRAEHQGYRRDYLAAPEARAMGAGRELFGRRKDGSELPVEIGLNPIQSSEGTFILASVIDVSERRQAERDGARQRNELAHLARVALLGELSGSLAHELNQPLTAILSNAQAAQEFLAQDPTNLDEVRGILQDIVDEDKRAREVIRRLRLLFRKGEVQFEALDLNELVLEVLKLMNSDLVNHGVSVETELAGALPTIRGDRVQLQQVLINLIVNASDAMTNNDINDRQLRASTTLDDGNGVRISLADSGCGIPGGQLEQIFEPFHTTKDKGMGLGLAVCRTIISAHAGKFWATNNPDRGACFHITLPALSGGSK